MALHDFCCPACDFVLRDVNVPIDVGATKALIICPSCVTYTEDKTGLRPHYQYMDWIPQIGRMSAAHGPTFTAFETYGPDNKKIRIESIADLRKVEAESEKMARDGRGQIMVWRDFSNDRSNKDQSAIPASWTAPGLDARASDWHDHPTFEKSSLAAGDQVAQRIAAEGAENATLKGL